MIEVVFLIPVHGRQRITEDCMAAMAQLKEEGINYGVYFNAYYVGNEEWLRYAVRKHDMRIITAPNDFLGRKMNYALQYLNGFERFDYLITAGSDDIFRAAMFASAKYMIAEGFKFFGPNDCYLLDSATGEVKRHNSGTQIIGAGRWHHRSLIERCDWALWPDDAMSGLDGRSERRIEDMTGEYVQAMPQSFPFVIDVKSSENIHSYEDIPGAVVDRKRVEKLFPSLRLVKID